jgi:secreted protein with Ig-like and vWFA domain/anti-sigma factor RsiW
MTNISKLFPDDPRLTAYALGELEGEELAAVEAALRDDSAARAAVEEIRATAGPLTAALATEAAADALPRATPPLRSAAIIPARDFSKLDSGPLGNVIKFPQFKFPQLYYIVGGLAAAAVAVLVVQYHSPVRRDWAEKKSYTEVTLQPAPEPAVKAEVDHAAATDAVSKASLPVAQDKKRDELATQTEAAKGLVAAAAPQEAAAFKAPMSSNRLKEMPEAPSQFQSVVANEKRVELSGKFPADIEKDRGFAGQAALPVTADASAGLVGNSPAANEGLQTMSKFSVNGDKDASYLKTNAATATRIGMEVQRQPLQVTKVVGSDRPESSSYYVDAAGNKVHDTKFSWTAGVPNPPRLDARFNPPGAGQLSFGGNAKTPFNAESYAYRHDNDFLGAAENPLSTFSADVDTASYANVRRFLAGGQLPPADAVRIEELVNYFPYHYAPPAAEARGDAATAPFAASLEVAEAPWAPTHRLVRIGLKGREVSMAARAAANLVFLLDVSGSMNEPNKLPLVKESMRLLVSRLRPDDRVAIVVYAGESGLALPSTPVAKSREILEALDGLTANGSTNGGMGIQLAYDIAKANFVSGGLNRVILCTDGDFNVGVTSEGGLVRLIEEKAKSGVGLTVLGFGMGNYKDAMLVQLAEKGNGNYGYVDTRREAEKLLVEQVSGTLVTIAKDVKLQVEFNPAQVASYRLIGYEDRLLKKEDFNDDAVNAGEIGAGHTVTALYEIVPASLAMGEGPEAKGTPAVDELKYGAVSDQRSAVSAADRKAESRKLNAERSVNNELLTLKVRYKEPAGTVSRKLEFSLTDSGARFADASADFKFAAAVAEFGMILRDSPHKGTGTLADVIAWAQAGTDSDTGGYRGEFTGLVRQAEALLR